jgi:ATP-dependent Clp endopeptidase proteolytic subunit ClpP
MPPNPFGGAPYKVPENGSEEWVKTHSLLYPHRIIFLGQEIDDDICNHVVSTMLYYDADDASQDQYLYINSPGGSVIAGLAVYDTMQHIGSPVITGNLGSAASMASFLLGAGVRGKRFALPDSRVMVHQPMGGSEGQAEDPRVEADQIYKIKNTLATMYAEMTGRTRAQIMIDLQRDNYMSAQQALDYGLIDKILPGEIGR